MKMTELATKTLRNAPADEVAKNAALLIKAGFIHKEMAGAYSYLPLGLKVLENIKSIVREEMNAIGSQEIIMTSLQRKELWERTDRWDDKNVDIWFKSKLVNGSDVGFGWSHEEPITDMMTNFISSHRDLPVYVYQFQTKLRNELRAKSGIMRGREFVMKDLYSYSASQEAHEAFYEQVAEAYGRIFDRIGIGDSTFKTFASGGAFTQFSHEFQTLCEAGEDTIYLHRERKLAVNKEVLTDEVLTQLELKRDDLEEVAAAEVGNIFSFGTAKSEQLNLYFTTEQGERVPVVLGSYGIGVTRLMGVIAELMGDERGLVWPEVIAPYKYHLIWLGDDKARHQTELVYQQLSESGQSVLFDDRGDGVRAGEKFADADLIGLPVRLVVSDKTGDKVEHKLRTSDQTKLVSPKELISGE